MLPNWLIKKIEKKKETFVQEQLIIEEFPALKDIEKIEKKEDIEERGVIVIDMF